MNLDQMKSIVVNDRNIDLIKSKLVLTVEYRTQLLKDKEVNLKEEFPYFFVSPCLVCYINMVYYNKLTIFNYF